MCGEIVFLGGVLALVAALTFTFDAPRAQQLWTEDLVKRLQEPPRTRGLTRGLDLDQPPPPKSRVHIDRSVGVTRDLTLEERKTLAEDVKTLKRPSADIEVYFPYDSAEMTAEAKPTLMTLGKALTDGRLKGATFIIAGHTDAKGSSDYNLGLSRHRARAVRQFLINNFAILPERLTAIGYGKERLKVPNEPFAAVNRRVEVINWKSMAKN